MNIFSKGKNDFKSLMEEVAEKLSVISRKGMLQSELAKKADKTMMIVRSETLTTNDKQILQNLADCNADLAHLIEDMNLNKNEHQYDHAMLGVLEFLKDPMYNPYFKFYGDKKLDSFDAAERQIRLKMAELEQLVDEGIKENMHNQQKAKDMFKEMKTLSPKSLRFKQLHMQIGNIDKNNKRYESKMKMLYTSRDNYRFLLDIILNIKEAGVSTRTQTGKEIMQLIRKLSNDVNLPNFKEVATKLSVFVKKYNESLLEEEGIVSSLSDHIYDQEIDVSASLEEYAEYEEGSDEEILEKIKNQYSMLEDE